MGFSKTGAIFKIAHSETLSCIGDWTSFKKSAAVKESTVDKSTEVEKEGLPKESDLEIVASVDTDKFIYIHTTIMAGVKTEDNGFWVTAETDKFANDNNDGWTCEDLLKDYHSFKRALTFVEHVQDLEKARGKCIDVIARKMPDTILIDVLFSVAKKHEDLVDNIKNGIVNAVSMGCSTERTICSICGNVAKDPSTYCSHIKNYKGSQVKCADGKSRRAVELCKGNTFFDVSLVANPAFAGAVFRKILSAEQVGTHLLANLISSKIEKFTKDNNLILKAASTETNGNIEIAVNQDGKVNIKANDQSFESGEKLPSDETQNMLAILTSEKSSTKFLSKIISKFFKRDSGYHPILNPSPIKDFSITDEDFSPIPEPFPQMRFREEAEKQIELRLRQPVEEGILPQMARAESFECYNCGHKDELWQVKASSIDNGFTEVYSCPQCGFLTESAKQFKKAISLTTVDRLQLQSLGFSRDDVTKLSSEHLQTILSKDQTKKEFEKTCNVLKHAHVTHNILRSLKDDGKRLQDMMKELRKGQVFVATKDIPVDNDEGTLHFDQYGSSVITKNEKLLFMGSVENGQYGFFRTEAGEEFFMPTVGFKKNNG